MQCTYMYMYTRLPAGLYINSVAGQPYTTGKVQKVEPFRKEPSLKKQQLVLAVPHGTCIFGYGIPSVWDLKICVYMRKINLRFHERRERWVCMVMVDRVVQFRAILYKMLECSTVGVAEYSVQLVRPYVVNSKRYS